MIFRYRISYTLPVITFCLSVVCSITVGWVAYQKADGIAGGNEQALSYLLNGIMWSALGAIVVTQAVGQYYASYLSRRISKMALAMQSISNGNLDAEIPCLSQSDELGEMAQALQSFKQKANSASALTASHAEEEAQKSTRQKAVEDMLKRFDAEMETVLSQLTASADSMQSLAQGMVSTAEVTSSRSDAVVAASDETAGNVRAVAAAAEQLSASIHEISNQVARSAEISQGAVVSTQSADGTVQELARSAEKIGAVINLIDDIADQINLLALNATIESARAGEAGKGFAVVASEVKNLASQTSKATQEIAAQIKAIQTVAGDVVKVLEGIRLTINEISGIATSIATSVEEQGSATQEIARNMSAAASIVQEVSNHSVAVKEASSEADGSAKNVLSASEALSQQSEFMRQKIEQFLGRIRTI